jgi:TonB family protein
MTEFRHSKSMADVYQGSSPNAHFLAGDVSGVHTPKSRVGGAASISFATHILGFLLIGYVATHLPEVTNSVTSKMDTIPDIVWLNTPGPGGGGGGGGNKSPDPPRKVELPGKEKITVPVTKPPKIENPEPPKDVPKPEQQLSIPAVQTASGVVELPGVISAAPSAIGPSQGSGSGGGAGTGTGTGIGSGSGSGLGPGSGGGTGGGVYQPGNGVTSPRLIKEVKPNYTGDAMRAKIQGVVTMAAVVMPDGSVGNVQITRSLDPTFGLDQEAIKTVKQWRFAPGMRQGQPVPVLVEIEMTFTLR